MILLIIFAIILIVGIIFLILGNNDYMDDVKFFVGLTSTFIGGIALIVMIVLISQKHLNYISYEIQREDIIIEYQSCKDLDNSKCDNALSKISRFNSNVKYRRSLNNSNWIGIFTDNRFNDLEIIILDDI